MNNFNSTEIYRKRLEKKAKRLAIQNKLSGKMRFTVCALYLINLDNILPKLESLYASNPRGTLPTDPVCMFRALLAMDLMGVDRIYKWVEILNENLGMAQICGFIPQKRPENIPEREKERKFLRYIPSVGTFYDFMKRLINGPYEDCKKLDKLPTEVEKDSLEKNLKAEKEARKEHQAELLDGAETITKYIAKYLIEHENEPRANDYVKRLEDIFVETSLLPTIEMGLFGNLQKLGLNGDGSCLRTGASQHGQRLCDCHKKGIYNCDCKRRYSDSMADWGYDSYHDCYYYGLKFYLHAIKSPLGYDLPVHVGLSPASKTDYTEQMVNLDRFMKMLKENNINLNIKTAAYDAGHDAIANHNYLIHHGIKPVIALNERSKTPLNPEGTAQTVGEDGIPICPGGLQMRRIGTDKERFRIYYGCPIKRSTHRKGKTVYICHEDECPQKCICQPHTKHGPVVYVRFDSDPRHFPAITRGSALYKQLYNDRTSNERLNSRIKGQFKMETKPYRSHMLNFVHLIMSLICIHAQAWLCEERQKETCLERELKQLSRKK